MKRVLLVLALVYLPHLLEEALTGMHDDPLIVSAWAPLSSLSSRHASYLVFQITFVLGLVMTVAYSRGGLARRALVAALGLAFVAEGHHLVRALVDGHGNPGLVTSLPMPLLGVFALRRALWPARG